MQVKLVSNGITSYRGTVYHYYNGTWGILCDEGWSLESATVVCNQLGLGKAISNPTSSFRGQPIEKFLVTKTHCKGDEEFLKDCPNELWTIAQSCSGQHVAEVVCEGIIYSNHYAGCMCVTHCHYSCHHASCMHVLHLYSTCCIVHAAWT